MLLFLTAFIWTTKAIDMKCEKKIVYGNKTTLDCTIWPPIEKTDEINVIISGEQNLYDMQDITLYRMVYSKNSQR